MEKLTDVLNELKDKKVAIVEKGIAVDRFGAGFPYLLLSDQKRGKPETSRVWLEYNNPGIGLT